MTPDTITPGQAQRHRIPNGGAIDRSRTLHFTFNENWNCAVDLLGKLIDQIDM